MEAVVLENNKKKRHRPVEKHSSELIIGMFFQIFLSSSLPGGGIRSRYSGKNDAEGRNFGFWANSGYYELRGPFKMTFVLRKEGQNKAVGQSCGRRLAPAESSLTSGKSEIQDKTVNRQVVEHRWATERPIVWLTKGEKARSHVRKVGPA